MPHWGIFGALEFIETSGFSALRDRYFTDLDFHLMQLFLMANPQAGDVIPAGGGVRKLRWGARGQGKRGGLRVIYYRVTRNDQILLITVYRKSETVELSRNALKKMRELVKGL